MNNRRIQVGIISEEFLETLPARLNVIRQSIEQNESPTEILTHFERLFALAALLDMEVFSNAASLFNNLAEDLRIDPDNAKATDFLSIMKMLDENCSQLKQMAVYDSNTGTMLDNSFENISAKNVSQENNICRVVLDQHCIMSITDQSGTIIEVNNKFCDITGYSTDELIGKNHRILNSGIHPADYFKNMWRKISSGKIWHGEICNKSKNGDFYWVESTIVPFLDDHGRPYQYVSVRTDITKQKHIEEELRVSDDRMQRSQIFANIGTWDWNIQTDDLYWSPRIAALFGYQEGKLETTYENFLNAVHPDDRQSVIDAVNNCVEKGDDYEIEHRCVWPDGTIHWMLERGDAVRAEDGTPLHMLGVVQDITHRKEAEFLLRESEVRLKEAQSIGHIGNWSWDVDSGQLYWSDEVFNIFGHTPGSFKPTYETFIATLHPDDVSKIKKSEEAAFSKGEKHSIDHRVILSDASVRWVHEEAVAELDNKGNPVSLKGTVQDITARKEAEQQLQKSIKEVEKASQAKSQFLSNMTHELRTPMNAILGFGQLLLMDMGESLSDVQQDNVNEILNAGNHLLDLINEILDLAKIESGNMSLSMEPVNVESVMFDVVNIMRPMAEKRGISICCYSNGNETSVTSDGNIILQLDNMRIKQVFLNLLSNAVKYNSNNGTLNIYIDKLKNERVRISVEDSGKGIANKKQGEVFQLFNRLDAEETEIEGTGIGLVITKQIVELMGGTIGFDSRPGEGSIFWVEFNVDSVHDTKQKSVDESEVKQDAVINNKKQVIYIEDNPANLRLVNQLLNSIQNIELIDTHDPYSGLDLIWQCQPELILLDINLPGIDGFEVLKRLKANVMSCDIPVIAISARAMHDDIKKAMESGFDEYLTKPLDVPYFLKILNQYLD